MIHRPWAPGTIDEWLPRSLRLCWGGDGDGGGGGFTGDSGFSGGFTGGGDWGSSGSFDASGFNAGGDLGAWSGTAYDASTFGSGAGGGGDWGSFGPTSYGGMNAPNPTFADIAGPNPGVTTGGGDWGSAGAYSAAGMGGGPGGGLYGGGGGGFYGDGGGGGLFGDYGGGGGGGYTGGGGGLYGGGGGSFGSFGTLGASNTGRGSEAPSAAAFTDTAGGGRLSGDAPAARSDAPTRSEAEVSSVSEADQAAPEAEPSDFGKPSEAAPEATPEAEPAPSQSESEAAPAATTSSHGRGIGSDEVASPSAFGPESVTSQEGRQALSDLTQSALDPGYQGAPYADMGPQGDTGQTYDGAFAGPDVVGSARGDPSYAGRGEWGDLPGIYGTGISNLMSSLWDSINSRGPDPQPLDFSLPTTPAWAQSPRSFELTDPRGAEQAQARIDAKSGWDINTYLSQTNQTPLNQAVFDAITSALSPAVNPVDYGKISAPLDLAPDLATQLGIQDVSATTPNTDWGSVFEGAAPPAQDLATQLGAQDIDATDWGSVFEGATPAPSGYDPTADQAAYDFGGLGQPYGQTDFGGWADTPAAPTTAADSSAPTYDTTMESGQPVAPTTTDDTTTLGGDPALSGLSAADAAAAGAGAGQPGQPGAPGQLGSIDPGVSPDAIANAASNAALDIGANPAAGDAASQAAQAAAEAGQSLVEVATAAMAAALEAGATQEQADAIAAAVYNAAVSKTENEVGTTPGAPPTTPTTPTTPTPSLFDMAQPGATRSESFIPGGRATDFNYPTSSTPPQAPPAALPPVAPADQPDGQPGQQPADQRNDDAADPHAPNQNAPSVQPGGRLGAPTTGTQNTPVVSRNVIQEQQGSTRNRPVSEALHGILSAAAERAGVTVHVGSGGQIATRAPGDRGRQGGWTGSVRHNHGNAADVRLEVNGRFLNYNNPQDRVVMETFVREAARLGATGMGAGITYMGPNTIHVGFGAPAFWRADNPGSRSLQQAYYEGRQGPANRPPTDIPNVRTAQPAPSSPSDFGPQTRGSQNAYAAARAPQIAEIRASPELQDRIATIINGEVGGKSVASKAAILEELLGRAAARGQTLFQATDPATRGAGYYQGGAKGTFSRGQGSVAGELPALLDRVGAGSNHSNFSTGNASGKTGVGQLNVKLEGEKHGLEADSRDRAFIAGIKAGTLPGARGIGSDRSNMAWADAVSPTQQIATPTPPPEVPAALPPVALPDVPVTRPPADIPAQAPAPFLTPPGRGHLDTGLQARFANDLLKDATKNLTAKSGEADFQAASVVAAKALAAAGIPAAMARSLMAKGAYEGAAKNGYDINSFPMGGVYKSKIDGGIDAALQGYHPARPGEVQGPYGFQPDAPTVAARAKGGPVEEDQPYLVGEQGPEVFVPDQPGTVWPHMPQKGGGGDFGRWPKLPTPDYPGRYAGVGREMKRQTREAQDPSPGLMDMIDSGQLRLTPNWHRMLNDPGLIALGRSRMDDRRDLDPGAEQYGAFIPAPAPAAEPPDPTNPMAQALGYGSIKRRPMQIGRQSY